MALSLRDFGATLALAHVRVGKCCTREDCLEALSLQPSREGGYAPKGMLYQVMEAVIQLIT